MLLFQLRRAQSNWYQELFQSSRDPLQQSSTYIWQTCQDMRQWSESFPESLSPAIKDLFELELLYSYVYCLAPSCRVPSVSELGKTLIFEYSLAYMEKMHPVSTDPVNTAFYTYHDALRVYFIGSQFTAVLSANLEQLLNPAVPYTSVIAGAPSPPPIPNLGRTDNIDRSINCIDQIVAILKTYGERWYDSKALQASFEAQVKNLLAELRRRRQHQQQQQQNQDEQARLSKTPDNAGPRLSPNHPESRLSDRWTHMGHVIASGTILQPDTQSRGTYEYELED